MVAADLEQSYAGIDDVLVSMSFDIFPQTSVRI
jgi:hypothetical protein